MHDIHTYIITPIRKVYVYFLTHSQDNTRRKPSPQCSLAPGKDDYLGQAVLDMRFPLRANGTYTLPLMPRANEAVPCSEWEGTKHCFLSN